MAALTVARPALDAEPPPTLARPALDPEPSPTRAVRRVGRARKAATGAHLVHTVRRREAG